MVNNAQFNAVALFIRVLSGLFQYFVRYSPQKRPPPTVVIGAPPAKSYANAAPG